MADRDLQAKADEIGKLLAENLKRNLILQRHGDRIMALLNRLHASPTLEIAAITGLTIEETVAAIKVLEADKAVVVKDEKNVSPGDLTRQIVFKRRPALAYKLDKVVNWLAVIVMVPILAMMAYEIIRALTR